MIEFFKVLAELLGVDEGDVQADSAMDAFEEWDSLGTLTVVSMIDQDYGVTILSEEIAGIQTAGQLWEMVESKRGQKKVARNDEST